MPAPVTVRRSRRIEGPLTRDAIVEAAMAITRDEGLEALTMRRLAADLRTAPMSVYRHVDDRQEILVAMLDSVAASIVLPPPSGEPHAEVLAVFCAIHVALRTDLWAVDLIVTHKLASSNILPAVERIYAAMRGAGLSADDTAAGYALLWQYTVGELLDTAHRHIDEYRVHMVHNSDRRKFPALHDVLTGTSDIEPAQRYRANLTTILHGILP